MGSIPGQGNKILNATRHGQRNRPKKTTQNKTKKTLCNEGVVLIF